MQKKIFNGQGFLTQEAKAFVNDGFTKEARRIIATATSTGDVKIIESILKSIIGEAAFEQSHKFDVAAAQVTNSSDTQVTIKKPNNVIQFPIKGKHLLHLIGAMDNPPEKSE